MTDYASIKNIKQRRLAFLNDTAKYYNINNRAMKNGRCQYSATENSPGCAIGRNLFTNVAAECDKVGSVSTIVEENKFNFFPQWMRQLGDNFLQDVQLLHDNGYGQTHSYWNETGLSSDGKDEYERIKNEYCV